MVRLLILFCSGFISYNLSGQLQLEKILADPYPSDLVKSENGKAIAWVTNTKGVRSIYSYNLIKDTIITHFSSDSDNGQVLSNLQFDDDANWLYFTYGSGVNRRGEAANPASFSTYPSRQLIRSSSSGSDLDRLGAHNNFVTSPNGVYLLLPKGNQLLRFDLKTKAQQALIGMRGTFANIKISPDGQSIIFVSQRGDHSFIGHFKYGDDRITWLSPGVDLDTDPQFSPDGMKVAFLRIPGHKKSHLNDITSGTTFQIMVHDLVSEKLDTIWTSINDAGGFAQYYYNDPLRWTKSNQIVFYGEQEGYMKIYVMNPDGSEVRSVIDGACEVEHSDISIDGSKIIFSANCGDIDRRDISIYDFGTDRLQSITTSPEIETHPILLFENRPAYLKGGERDVTAVYLIDGIEKRLSAPSNSDFPGDKLVTPRQVIFQAEDGLTIHGQLFDNGQGSGKPAVIFMHGGPIRQMLLGYHYSSYYANAYSFNQYLTSKGYVVLSVNFRSGIGYGKDFRRASNQGPRGASEYQDIIAAARYLQSQPNVDPGRIGLWGGSYGGFLTAMGLARNSEIFKAGVDFHGVHDWAWRAKDFSEGGFWGINEELMKEALASSPVSSVNSWTSPVLFIHGDDDRNVMFGQTVDLVQRLRKQGTYHEILVLPDEVHGFYRWESWLRSFQKAADFFDRKL